MLLIQNITDDPIQQTQLVLPDGSVVSLQLYYSAQQYVWFIQSLTYQNFTLCGVQITNSPNILRQFVNQLPFGLACYTVNNREPSQIGDFSSGASQLFILTELECSQYDQFLSTAPLFNLLETYDLGDLVTYQGNVYASLSDNNLGNTPSGTSTYWGDFL